MYLKLKYLHQFEYDARMELYHPSAVEKSATATGNNGPPACCDINIPPKNINNPICQEMGACTAPEEDAPKSTCKEGTSFTCPKIGSIEDDIDKSKIITQSPKQTGGNNYKEISWFDFL